MHGTTNLYVSVWQGKQTFISQTFMLAYGIAIGKQTFISQTFISMSSIVKTGLQHIFPHFSTFFHIFPHFPHFSTFFHPYHYISQTVVANYTIVKRKWGIPKTLLMDTLILNLKPFVSESSKKAVPQYIFPKLLYPQNILPKLSLQKNLKKRQNNPCWDS